MKKIPPVAAVHKNLRMIRWNELGQVYLPLLITTAMRPGAVRSDKGACYNDARVEVSAR